MKNMYEVAAIVKDIATRHPRVRVHNEAGLMYLTSADRALLWTAYVEIIKAVKAAGRKMRICLQRGARLWHPSFSDDYRRGIQIELTNEETQLLVEGARF